MSENIDELRWVRVFSPIHIPKYLVEQIRDRDFTVDDFYKYQEINCLIDDKDGKKLNPFNHLYVLANEENFVKGFLWFIVDPLSKDVVINTFSMDKEYWGQGKAVKNLSEHVKEILKKLKLNKVYWMTNYPKHSERYGFKRSKSVLMEFKEVNDGKNTDRRSSTQGERELVDSGAAIAS
jgi:N-acetylglutamate synthase-like GNAT family acetyltransferase